MKRLFKATAARLGDNMHDVIEALMRLYAEKPDVVDKHLSLVKRRKLTIRRNVYF